MMTAEDRIKRYEKIKRAANKIDKERTNRRTELRRKWESKKGSLL